MSEPEGPAGRPDDPSTLEDQASLAQDRALLRRVRWRLVGWSGGITLVILLVLGAAFYTAIAERLESASLTRLEARVEQIVPDRAADLNELPPLQLLMGGPSSGTFAYLIAPDGSVVRPPFDAFPDLPDTDAVLAALGEGRDERVIEMGGVPFRLLTLPISGSVVSPSQGRLPISAIQVVEDLVAERRTLDLVVEVLVVGGIIALLVALAAGAFYSGRALVPIRESQNASRRALRRQREFAADASHELRTPLTIIRSSVEDLRLHAHEPVATVGDALDDIDAEVAHVTSLVDDLLLLARSDSGALDLDFQPVELGDVAASAASSMAGPAGRKDVTIAVDPEPVMVYGDHTRLRQLVTILIDNGVRHSPPGGVVDVRVRAEADRAVLVVDDRGSGIDPEDLPRVFDRFWRGRGEGRGGAGLGLSIAEAIVVRHGGDIVAAARPGGGARFTVRLPVSGGATPGAG